jgi:hypothetical protein
LNYAGISDNVGLNGLLRLFDLNPLKQHFQGWDIAMKNPLDSVPLNTKRQYVMATTYNGCEVYMPVDSTDDRDLLDAKARLQAHLDGQSRPPPQAA